MRKNANAKLIILSILAGVLVIVSFAFFFKNEEKVTLPIKLEEFADFECPACGYYYAMVEKVVAHYGSDNVDYEFKHFPLVTIHKFAYNASLAAEAAREQGKFSEYSHVMFVNNAIENAKTDNQEEFLTDAKLLKYAADLGLNVEKFKTDMKSDVIKARVDADVAEASKRGIGSTPTFYINGKQFRIQSVSGATTNEEVEAAIIKQFTDYIDARIDMANKQKSAK
jgi:protein-disulfide isomerase